LWGRVRGAVAAGATKAREEIVQEELDAAAMLETAIQQESGAGRRASEGQSDESEEAAESSEDTHDSGAEIEDAEGAIERAAEEVTDKPADATAGLLPSEHDREAPPSLYTAVAYPEWDTNAGQYLPRGAIVRAYPPREEASRWADDVLLANAALVRQVRQRFERLRARRRRLRRQRDGDELDLEACVRALVDRQMGHAPDDNLYIQDRPARRALAIALLVDISGSTNTPVSDGRRIIDVEKIALLMASEALDALGDRYAMLTFASDGAADVRVTNLKDFTERNGETVRRRIAAIVPEGNTRLGAAVRHATALLQREPAGHRLLLILSDGKPQDVDRYFPEYAIEDSRQAVIEARSAGVYPFCLTVDPEDPEAYVSHIFGASGHTILRRADHLPHALLQCVRQLLGSR
jgi:nitric oxide reductase NorD protein